ncbi:hypothetical protein [Psychrobacter urativorans]|uniref:hypothetical protein n=1 Tax=Psychrobacter urativorans TaxID=45610 RepID=UPI00191B3285|nr:hypothetical protein [Psychrobacter urativorans]
MAKRTKFSKFKSLYSVIDNLLDTYTQEGTVEILAESHDLELSLSTLRSYLYRYKKQLKELSVATDNSSSKVEINHEGTKQRLGDSQSSEPIQEDNTDVSTEPYIPPTREELDAAMRKMIKQQELGENRSLFVRR